MYPPVPFAQHEFSSLLDFLKRNPFGIVIHSGESLPVFTPIPFSIHEEKTTFLSFHLAAYNPQCALLKREKKASFCVQGHHHYISPQWYPEGGVPTYNYEVAMVHGEIEMVNNETAMMDIETMLRQQESHIQGNLQYKDIAPEMIEGLRNHLLGFRMKISSFDFRCKLSQNKSETIRKSIISNLKTLNTPEAKSMADLIQQHSP